MNEQEMREAKVPWFKTEQELIAYIDELVSMQHNYGTCVYAASMASTATFRYISGKLGMTGFQAGCADLDIIRRTRGLERFILIDIENALYPQYDLHNQLTQSLEKAKPWLKEKAIENLEGLRNDVPAASSVVEHWRKLAYE